MSIASVTELDRTYEFDAVGQVSRATRRWAVSLADGAVPGNVTQAQALTACGVTTIGTLHPDANALKLFKVQVKERLGESAYHHEVIAEYAVLQNQEDITPISRTSVWSFESKTGQVPALFYYDGVGNDTMYPLTNSAYDYFEGLTAEESMVEATVRKNYQNYPTAQIAATNSVNNALYLGGEPHAWKASGVNTTYTQELFGTTLIKYWETESKLLYRQSGWKLQLPDVGFNQIVSGQKRRCMVFDFQNSEWIPSPSPVALSGGVQVDGRPAILPRRVNPEADFQTIFGAPPQ